MKHKTRTIVIGVTFFFVFLPCIIAYIGLKPRNMQNVPEVGSPWLKTFKIVKEKYGKPPIYVKYINDDLYAFKIIYLDRYIYPTMGTEISFDKNEEVIEIRSIRYNGLIIYLFPGYQKIKFLAKFR